MKQYTVPQFIDVEDKIIGPITVRQFVILIVAGLVLFLEYKLSDMTLFIILAIPTIFIFGTFAFAKVNGIAFHYFILNVIQTLKKPALRIWQRDTEIMAGSKSSDSKKKEAEEARPAPKKPIVSSRLSDLSLIIDTGGIYEGEETERDLSFNNIQKDKNEKK